MEKAEKYYIQQGSPRKQKQYLENSTSVRSEQTKLAVPLKEIWYSNIKIRNLMKWHLIPEELAILSSIHFI